MRRFLSASLAVLALGFAFHLGASSGKAGLGEFVGVAGSQTLSNPGAGVWFALTDDGRIFRQYIPNTVGWTFHHSLPGGIQFAAIASRHNEQGLPQFMALSADGQSWRNDNLQGWHPIVPIDTGGEPGQFVSLDGADAGPYMWVAVMDTGRWFYFDDLDAGWHYGGNIHGQATTVAPTTWGRIKADPLGRH